MRRGLTDETGAFRFEGISNDPETVYLVGADFIALDIETADAYRGHWEGATGLEHHPYWDIVTCVDFLPDWRPSARGNDRLESWLGHLLSEMTG